MSTLTWLLLALGQTRQATLGRRDAVPYLREVTSRNVVPFR
ncbi:MAG TPA: hypothetical protein VHD32_04720 [Candidatus Didemnitutus sp.]|nr:hypothetical protein [Candidatus Didemnitutus sp.]